MRTVELHDSADVRSVNDKENQIFNDGEGCDINNRAEESVGTFVKESFSVIVLKPSSDRQNRCVPERYYCEWDRFVGLRSSMEVVITVES